MQCFKRPKLIQFIFAFLGLIAILVLLISGLDHRALKKHEVIKLANMYYNWREAGCPTGLELRKYLQDDKKYEMITNVCNINNNELYSFIVFVGTAGYPPRSLLMTTNGLIIFKKENNEASIVAEIKNDENGKYSITWR